MRRGGDGGEHLERKRDECVRDASKAAAERDRVLGRRSGATKQYKAGIAMENERRKVALRKN